MGSTVPTLNQHISTLQLNQNMTPKVVLLVAAVAILGSDAAVLRREKRTLGLVKSAAAAAATAAKIGAGVVVAKPLALGLLGKYALYKWVTSGSNAGITADAGLGPLQFKESLGYEYGAPEAAAVAGQAPVVGEVWYEPIDASTATEETAPVVIDEGAWVPAGAQGGEFLEPVYADNPASASTDLLGGQGGFQLGPLSFNAGLSAGR